MKKLLKVLVTLLAILAAALVFRGLEHRRPVEPSFGQRPLTAWLGDILMAVELGKAEQAVQAIGTNAIPFLVWELQVAHSPLKRNLIEWTTRQSFLLPMRRFLKLPPSVTEEWHHDSAVAGFILLGLKARPALPAVMELLARSNTVLHATKVLGQLDNVGKPLFPSEVVPAMLISLTSPVAEARSIAANVLGLTQTNKSVVVPALLASLKDREPRVRAMAAMSLGGPAYRSELATIIPALIDCLNDTNSLVRARAARRLGLFGDLAGAALPALSNALADSDPEVKQSVARAIDQIGTTTAPSANP